MKEQSCQNLANCQRNYPVSDQKKNGNGFGKIQKEKKKRKKEKKERILNILRGACLKINEITKVNEQKQCEQVVKKEKIRRQKLYDRTREQKKKKVK